MPRNKYNSLTNKAVKVTDAILKPTEKRIVSKKLISFILRSLRIANPGINDRKTKTMISLRAGIFSKIARLAKRVIIGIIIKTFAICPQLSISLMDQDKEIIL